MSQSTGTHVSRVARRRLQERRLRQIACGIREGLQGTVNRMVMVVGFHGYAPV